MREDHFTPAAPNERTTWARFTTTVKDGARVIRRSRTLVLLAVVIAVAGGSSEAYDRFREQHLLLGVGVPTLGDHGQLVTLAVLFTTSSGIGVLVAWRMERRLTRRGPSTRRWLVGLVLAQSTALVVFALTGSFPIAAVMVVLIDRVRSVRQKLFAAWIVPLTPKAQRATVLSAFSQCDAVGQVTVGPALGVVAGVWSVPASIVVSAVVLAPTAAVVSAAHAADVTREAAA
jgi:DHA3 family tetracycline resistance protein-like MFS transporter